MAVRYDWLCDTCDTVFEQTYAMANKPSALQCPMPGCVGTCRSIIEQGQVLYAGGQEDFHDRNLDSELAQAEADAHAGADYFRQGALERARIMEQSGAADQEIQKRYDFADRHHRDTVRRADKAPEAVGGVFS